MHSWGLDVFKYLLPGYVVTAELVIIATLFVSIKLINNSGIELILSFVGTGIAITALSCVKAAMDYAWSTTKLSQKLSRIGRIRKNLTKEDKLFLISCRPLKIKVGNTFTITNQTLPTIVQDIVMGSLINLLLAFR